MMGLKERTFAPVVALSLEELVPQKHFYRHLHKVLDLSFVYDLVRESYSVAGRPSIDPVVFVNTTPLLEMNFSLNACWCRRKYKPVRMNVTSEI